MATIELYENNYANTHQTENGSVTEPYVMEIKVDIADVVAKKGSALEAGDEVRLTAIPSGAVVIYTGATVTENSSAGTVADFTVGDGTNTFSTVNVGSDAEDEVTGGSVSATLYNDETSIFATVGATNDPAEDGEFRFFAMLADVSPKNKPGLVRLGT